LGIAILVVTVVAMLTTSALPSLAAEEPTGEAPPYSIFYSPPDRVEALFAAFMECVRIDLTAPVPYYTSEYRRDVIDTERLLALEQEYGDMPEYWQLRVSSRYWTHSSEELEANELLDRMLEVGPDDPLTNWLYAKCYDFADQVLKEEAMLPYSSRAVELAPGQAAYHYELAHVLFRLGEFEEALQQVQAGNSAARNRSLCAFPDSYFRTLGCEIADVQEWQLKLLLSGRSLSPSMLQDYIGRKDIFKDVLVAFNLSGDLEAMNDMHQWAIRMVTAKGATLIDTLVAVVMVGILADGASKGSETQLPLTDGTDTSVDGVCRRGVMHVSFADRRGFARLERLRREVTDRVKHLNATRPSLWSRLNTLAGAQAEGMDFLSAMTQVLKDANRAWLTEPDWVARELKPIFEEMAKFDYTNPAAFAEESENEGGEK